MDFDKVDPESPFGQVLVIAKTEAAEWMKLNPNAKAEPAFAFGFLVGAGWMLTQYGKKAVTP